MPLALAVPVHIWLAIPFVGNPVGVSFVSLFIGECILTNTLQKHDFKRMELGKRGCLWSPNANLFKALANEYVKCFVRVTTPRLTEYFSSVSS